MNVENPEKYLVVVIGPTAIGKTSSAITLANFFSSEIISADSRQFYKEMAIGTAIPTPEELSNVPHHFIHHKSIEENYSVGDFEEDAISLLHEKFKKHDILFLVGGSGLYIDAVLTGLDNFPKVDKSIREDLKNTLKQEGIKVLQDKLQELDPGQYKNMDVQNPQRVIRALEICIGTGLPYSSFLSNPQTKRPFKTIKIGLTAERNLIYTRINKRVDEMMGTGLLDEVKSLESKQHLNALQTVGYRELFSFLKGEISFEDSIEEIKKNTRRYAKRQLTWFRKDEEIKWFNHDTDCQEIINYIKSGIS